MEDEEFDYFLNGFDAIQDIGPEDDDVGSDFEPGADDNVGPNIEIGDVGIEETDYV